MASTVIGALRVIFSADSAAFEAGTKRVRQNASATAKSMGLAKSAVAGFFGAFTIGILATAAKRALDYAGSIGELSQQLGVTTRDLQSFRYMAGQVGVSQEQLETGLSKLTITMGKVAAGAKAPTQAFNAIGISVDQLKGKDTGEVFRMISDGLAKIPDRAQRAAVEVALFGKTGSMLDNMLAGGRGAIDQLAVAAEKLGIVLSDEQIQNADDTADKLEQVKTVLSAQIAGVVANNAKSILSLSQALASLTGEIVRFLNSNPQLALGIIGALLGGRVGGLPGAVIGGAAGAILGGRMAQNQADSNMDPHFRAQQLRGALKNYRDAKSGASDPTGKLGSNPAAIAKAKKELQRQLGLATTVKNNMGKPKPGSLGNVVVPQFLAGGGGGGGHKAKPKEDHTAERELTDNFRFGEDLRRSQMDVLRAQQDLSHDYIERTKLSIDMLDLEKQSYEAELKYQTELYKLTSGEQGMSEAQAAQLKAQYDKKDSLERQAVLAEEEERRWREGLELDQKVYDHKLEVLGLQDQLADTAAERRKIELEMLRIAYEQKRQMLNDIIQHSKDFAEVEQARRDLEQLDRTQPLAEQGVRQQTRGPLEQYQADYRNIDEKMQQLEVNGIQGAVHALAELRHGWSSMRDAAIQALDEITGQMLELQLNKLAAGLFGKGKEAAAGVGSPTGEGAAQLAASAASLTASGTTLTTAGGSLTSSASAWALTAAQIMAAAEALATSGAMSGGGGGGGLGSFLSIAGSLIGGSIGGGAGGAFSAGMGASVESQVLFGSGVMGFAQGGSGTFLGKVGTDRNMLSMNGVPIARVSHGEPFKIGNDNNDMDAGGYSGDINVPITVIGGGRDGARTGFQAGQAAARQLARVTRRRG